MGEEEGATNGFPLITLKTIFRPSRVLLDISCILSGAIRFVLWFGHPRGTQ